MINNSLFEKLVFLSDLKYALELRPSITPNQIPNNSDSKIYIT